MKIFRLSGGLGNQFFSYAACYQYCRDHNEPIVIDTSTQEAKWFFRDFDISNYNIRIDKKICYRLGDKWYDHLLLNHVFRRRAIGLFTPTIYEDKTAFQMDAFNSLPKHCYVIGDWQYLGYFDRYYDELRNVFTYNQKLSTGAELMKKEIDSVSCSVAVHARRGDKAQVKDALDERYYHDAIGLASKILANEQITFFCFSEDIDWIKNVVADLSDELRFVFMDYESDRKGLEDFELMRFCDHQIVADSTYSFWAAYLNSNPEKKVFYNDNGKEGYWPKSWIRV